MAKLFYKTRLLTVFVITFLLFSILLARLLWLQLFNAEPLSRLAENQHKIMIQLEAVRGSIYDRNMHPLAVNLKAGSIYASPVEVKEKSVTARALAPVLGMDEKSIMKKLRQDRSFVWLARKMDYQRAKGVEELGLKGIGMVKEAKRFYPCGSLASHVIGFAGIDNIGLEGLEVSFDGYLRGTPGWSWTTRDAKARRILSRQSRLISACDGYDLVLAIDEVIQHIAEKELNRVFKKFRAKAASVVVMDPYTGDILALANRPAFDLNKSNLSGADSRRNRVVTDIFEPGSVFKIVTASAVLEEGAAELDDVFFCEEGSFKIGDHVLHDHKPHGELTFKEVIEFSSNIGTVKAAQLLEKDDIFGFIKSFGFGSKTRLSLPGEVNGIIRSPASWSGTSIAAIPIGQEIAVTPIQLIAAVSAVANGGILMKPRIVLEVRDRDGGLVEKFEPASVRRVISEPTAFLMKEILEGVVERGTGRNARLSEYRAGGKTGTAQKVETNGRYSHSKFIASFAGFAPLDNPRVAVLVCVDEPKGIYYGSSVAAPAFREITQSVLRYLKVEPDREIVLRR